MADKPTKTGFFDFSFADILGPIVQGGAAIFGAGAQADQQKEEFEQQQTLNQQEFERQRELMELQHALEQTKELIAMKKRELDIGLGRLYLDTSANRRLAADARAQQLGNVGNSAQRAFLKG